MDQFNFKDDTVDSRVRKGKKTDPVSEETIVMAKLVDAFLLFFFFTFPSTHRNGEEFIFEVTNPIDQ